MYETHLSKDIYKCDKSKLLPIFLTVNELENWSSTLTAVPLSVVFKCIWLKLTFPEDILNVFGALFTPSLIVPIESLIFTCFVCSAEQLYIH